MKQGDVLEFGENEEKFDYIIAKGIFSWVSRDVQDKILKICRDHLNPQGIAYINYNTYPGWRVLGMFRDMMKYHTSKMSDPETIANQSRALMALLSMGAESDKRPYGEFLKSEFEKIKKYPNDHIIRIYHEGINEPCYFHEFSRRADDFGLQYLGEAEFHEMLSSDFTPKVRETLNKLTNDLTAREQYMDFLRNSTQRQTLLCHKNIKLNRAINIDIINSFYITRSTILKPESDKLKLEEEKDYTYTGRNNIKVTCRSLLEKTYFKRLNDLAPQAIMHKDAFEYTQKDIYENTGKKISDNERVKLSRFLLNCYANGIIKLNSSTTKVVNKVSEFPMTSELARYQARASLKITNQNHTSLSIDLLLQQMIQLLDGENNLKTIKDKLLILADSGELIFNKDNEIVSDRVMIEKIIDEKLETNLNLLLKLSYLIG